MNNVLKLQKLDAVDAKTGKEKNSSLSFLCSPVTSNGSFCVC